MNYAAHYTRLMDRARARVLDGYVERHHVLPRCMGGGDEVGNLVALTAEEHFVAHLLLCKMHPLNKRLAFAAWQMATTRNGVHVGPALRVGARTYGRLRREASAAISATLRGKKKSPEHVAKVAAAQRGKSPTPEANEARHAPLRGRKQTPEAIAARAASLRGKPYRLMTCPHCNKTGGGGAMVRNHFDRCRSLIQPDLIH